LDPATGKVTRYPSPGGAAPHTGFADSKGRLWYNSLFAPHVVGMFDTKTKKIVEMDPSPSHKGGGYYDVVDGLNGLIYAAGSSNGVLASFDPKTQKWTDHIPPDLHLNGSAAAISHAPRRLATDSKGRIWFTMTGANAIGVFDPQTDTFKTYTIPVRYTNPYAIQVDRDDNVWTDLAWAQPETFLGKFDSKTEKFSFYPYPNVRDHNAQLKVDPRKETLWFGSGESGQPRGLTSLKPKGNLPIQTAKR
jgi:streptogramin lyase